MSKLRFNRLLCAIQSALSVWISIKRIKTKTIIDVNKQTRSNSFISKDFLEFMLTLQSRLYSNIESKSLNKTFLNIIETLNKLFK